MNVNALLTDDDAVSPVIGVILMVAITVILAAVIGTFVLGIGQNQQTTPSASFDFDWSASDGELDIAHAGGDNFNSENSNAVTIGTPYECTTDGTSGTADNDWLTDAGTVSAGNSFTVHNNTGPPATVNSGDPECILTSDLSSGDDIRVLWESPGGDKTQSVGSFTIP